MKKMGNKLWSVLLSAVILATMLFPGISALAASVSIIITLDGTEVTERLTVQEYRSVQLGYITEGELPEGTYVTWESKLPLLAGVDDSGKVTGYDYSKEAIIHQWIDENIRSLPLVGDAMANSIEQKIQETCESMNIDLADMNNDMIVSIVRIIAGDALADSLKTALDNMNVEIIATLHAPDGSVLATDAVEVVVEKSVIGSIAPTGVHITNKKSVPLTVAVGAQVQLYGACTPVRLKQGIKWTMGGTIFDIESGKHANISSDGLVTFTSAGTVTVRVNPESAAYAAFTDTITFTVLDPADLPVEDFTIVGTMKIDEGETTQLAIDNYVPEGAYFGDLTWESSDPTVAVIDQNGVVTALDGGSGLTTYSRTTTITATAGGVSRSVEFTVSRKLIDAKISGIEIVGEPVIPNNISSQYEIKVTPDRLNTSSSVQREWGITDPMSGEIVWATADVPADINLATLSANGLLTPKQSGIMTVHGRAIQGETVLETSMVVNAGTPIDSFTLETGDGFSRGLIGVKMETYLKEGSSAQINMTNILPADFDRELLDTVVWESSDPTVATVDENGRVFGMDAGGLTIYNSKSVTITARVSGVSASITFNVRGASVQNLVAVDISGNDYVIKDFPISYNATFAPPRISVKNVHWGVPYDDGSRPWESKWDSTSGNTQNAIASVDGNGTVSGLSAGETDLYVFGREGVTVLSGSFTEDVKHIQVVELEPTSITLTAPTRKNYVEGETELDLTGLKVALNYNKEDVAKYYDITGWSDSDFSVEVTDYTVTEINQSILDTEQYMLVSVTRAGETYRGVFPIILESKKVTGIELKNPRYAYSEGEIRLDLEGLEVTACYSNAEPELVTDYNVDRDVFDPTLLDVEQQIPVTYTHAGLSATAYFPVIIYGTPVVTVDTNGYDGNWTPKDISFTLSATHPMDGLTYYYYTDSNSQWVEVEGDRLTISQNINDTYYFKAVNSVGVSSEVTAGYSVKRDDVTPSFDLTPSVTEFTNEDYAVSVDNLTVGESGIRSVTLNGADVTDKFTPFTVSQNGTYTVIMTAENGLHSEKSVEITNIDKIAPVITSVQVEHKNKGGFARLINEITYGKFFNEEIVLTVTAEDEGVSGLKSIEYRWYDEDTETYSAWAVYDPESLPVKAPDFKGFAEVRAFDGAGNVSLVVAGEGFTIDDTAPTPVYIDALYDNDVYDSESWAAGDVKISLNSTAYSGIYAYYVRMDSGEWQELSGNVFTAAEEGTHLYEFKAVSNSDLESEITEITVKIDRQKPVMRVAFDGTFGRWTSEGARFNFSTEEESLSGITYYYNDGTGWYEFDGSELNLTKDTNAVYSFKAVNGAGTESITSDSYRVMIDTAEPTITFIPAVTGITSTPYEISYEVVTGPSGLQSVVMDGVDITDISAFTVSQNGNHLVTVTGANGKSKTVLLTVNNFIDYTQIPILQVGFSGALGIQTDKPVVFTLTTPNYSEGITYYYSVSGEWIELEGNTFTIDTYTKATFTFKAVNSAGVESYVSPQYSVWFEKPEITGILPVDETGITIDRTNEEFFIFGLTAEANTVFDLKARLQNDSTQIIVMKGDTVLSDGDLIGTGCTVKCISMKDTSVVYETATVIINGDIDGDGLINDTDIDIVNNYSCALGTIDGECYRIAADVNGDGAIDAYDAIIIDFQYIK